MVARVGVQRIQRERAFCMWFVNVALVRVVSRTRAPTAAAWASHAEPVTSNEVSDPLIRRLEAVPQANMLPNSP